jgi:hypothetical protein
MTQDELEDAITKGRASDKETGDWFAKYHDANYPYKGLGAGEFTLAAIREEISISRSLRAGYSQLDLVAVNAFLNESALKSLLQFFLARKGASGGAERSHWSLHAVALGRALKERGILKAASEDLSGIP